MAEQRFEEWAILELMGHRRLAGLVTEQTIGGASFIRIDVPCDPPATQLYAPGAIYCITPTTEQLARQVAQATAPRPIERWELPAAPQIQGGGGRACRVCGCTDEDCSGCIERTGEPCYWVEEDLCSACAAEEGP